jgi:hypothetical protein
MEIRVYGIDLENYEFDTFPGSWEDEKFISEAEIQGNVWSLQGFERDFNEDSLNQNNLFIRFYDSKSINVD